MAEIQNKIADEPVVSAEALKKAEQYIEEEEGAINKLPGALGVMATALAVIMFAMLLVATAIYFRMFRTEEVFS